MLNSSKYLLDSKKICLNQENFLLISKRNTLGLNIFLFDSKKFIFLAQKENILEPSIFFTNYLLNSSRFILDLNKFSSWIKMTKFTCYKTDPI